MRAGKYFIGCRHPLAVQVNRADLHQLRPSQLIRKLSSLSFHHCGIQFFSLKTLESIKRKNQAFAGRSKILASSVEKGIYREGDKCWFLFVGIRTQNQVVFCRHSPLPLPSIKQNKVCSCSIDLTVIRFLTTIRFRVQS